jgi:hypothetical protein
MLESVVLCFVLSRQPITSDTSETERRISFDSMTNQILELRPQFQIIRLEGNANIKAPIIKDFSTSSEVRDTPIDIADRFRWLADEWSSNTRHISSTKDLVSNSNYQEIIGLGWNVVPFLLKDLQENKRFWFPALYAITKVRPFDSGDAGNGKRMTEAWVKWGKRKGLI